MTNFILKQTSDNVYLTVRDGMRTLQELTGNPQGTYRWEQENRIIAMVGGILYSSDINEISFSRISNDIVGLGDRAAFVEILTDLYVSAGGYIFKISSNFEVTRVTSALAPEASSDICSMTGSLISISHRSDTVRYSDPLDPTNWRSLRFVTAEKNSDYILRIEEMGQEVAMVGERSIEILYNDGVTPFITRQDIYYQVGAYTDRCVENTKYGLFFYGSDRRIYNLDLSYNLTDIGDPVYHKLEDLSEGETVLSSFVQFQHNDFIVFSFFKKQLSIAYNIQLNAWSEILSLGKPLFFIHGITINAGALVMDRSGSIIKISHDITDDFGEPISSSVETGFIGHDHPYVKKQGESLYINGYDEALQNFNKVNRYSGPPTESLLTIRRSTTRTSAVRRKQVGSTNTYRFIFPGQYNEARYIITHTGKKRFVMNKFSERFEYLDAS